MKRCLHVIPMNKLSGAEKMALLICKNLKEYTPVVICGGDNLKSIFEAEGIKTYAINFEGNSILRNAKEISDIVDSEGIDIIHAHDNTASILSYISKIRYRLNCKLISHIHSCYPWLCSKGVNKIIDSIMRKKYDCNIMCGKFVDDYYKNNANYIRKSNVEVLTNSVDMKDIEKYNSIDSELYNKFGIPKDKIILGYVGRLIKSKGLSQFINAFKEEVENFNDCIILIIGSGKEEENLKNMVKKYKLEDKFIFIGYQEDVYKFYPLIDIMFLPSMYEGLPMVVLEAMVFKSAVISTDVGGIKEIINKNTGVLVQSNNYNEFIEKLINLKNQKHVIRNLSENAFNLINENYNIDKYVNNLEKVYDKQK